LEYAELRIWAAMDKFCVDKDLGLIKEAFARYLPGYGGVHGNGSARIGSLVTVTGPASLRSASDTVSGRITRR
jgi:hypothetical protein